MWWKQCSHTKEATAVARYLSSFSGFDLFPGDWFLKCSVLLVNQATAVPKAFFVSCSLAPFISWFYLPFSFYFHIKFHVLCSDPVSQYIWHPFNFFLLSALHLQVRANVRSLQLVSLCGSFRQIRNTEGSTNSSSGFSQYFLQIWHKSSLFLSDLLLCDTPTAWSLWAE